MVVNSAVCSEQLTAAATGDSSAEATVVLSDDIKVAKLVDMLAANWVQRMVAQTVVSKDL